MSFPSSTALQVAFAVALVVFTAYAGGRVHQWYRHGFEREEAFREGYDQASHGLFKLVTRSQPAATAPSVSPRSVGHLSGRVPGLHSAGYQDGADPTRFDVAGAM
jgi:hypothetical protein